MNGPVLQVTKVQLRGLKSIYLQTLDLCLSALPPGLPQKYSFQSGPAELAEGQIDRQM